MARVREMQGLPANLPAGRHHRTENLGSRMHELQRLRKKYLDVKICPHHARETLTPIRATAR